MHHANRVCTFAIACLAVLSACGYRTKPIQTTSSLSIYYGEPVPEDQWRSVVGIAYRQPNGEYLLGCTGTLVHPQLVLTAGHCLKGAGLDTAAMSPADLRQTIKIYVGNGQEGGLVKELREVEAAAYHPLLRHHPLGNADLGFLKLANKIENIEIVPLASELAEVLPFLKGPGQSTIVGFGRREDNGSGVKYAANVQTREGTSHEIALGGSEGQDACTGDSGGPAFITTASGKTVQLGVISRGLDLSCGPGSYIGLVSDSLCWIEQASGISLAPKSARCLEAPHYDDQSLKALSFAALCQGEANPTQAFSIAALKLKSGIQSCDELSHYLQSSPQLNLDYAMLNDLSFLAPFTHIEELSLRGNHLTDISPLRSLIHLKRLSVAGNDIKSFAPLAGSMKSGLRIYGKKRQNSTYSQTSFLAACLNPNLSAGALATVKAIRWKTMTQNCDEANERLLGMRSLTLRSHDLTDLSPLSDLENLVKLDLSKNPLTDISPLRDLESLKQLDLRDTSVEDLAPLASLIEDGLVVLTSPKQPQ